MFRMLTKKCASALFLGLGLIIFASPAQAVEINEAGAQKLKGLFEKLLDEQIRMSDLSPKTSIEYQGEITVTPAESYYAVSFPQLKTTYPDGSFFDFGAVAINAAPLETAGQWKMNIALPTPIMLIDPQGTQKVRIDIGGQRAAGIWDESLGTFSRLDARFSDIAIKTPYDFFNTSIPEARIRYNYKKDAQGLWSGKGFMAVKDIEAAIMLFAGQANIGELRVDFSMDRYNPEIMSDYKKQIVPIVQKIVNSAEAQEETPQSPEEINSLVSLLSNVLTKGGNGFDIRYSAKDVDISIPSRAQIKGSAEAPPSLLPSDNTAETEAETKAQKVKLAEAFFTLGMNGFLDNNVSLNIGFGTKGVETTPQNDYTPIIPTDTNFNIKLENLPFPQIAKMGQNTLQASLERPESAKMASLGMVMKLPALLSQAGTRLIIKDNGIKGQGYNFTLNGEVKADMMAVNSATAQATALFTGLDGLLSYLQNTAASTQDPAEAQKFQQISGMLSMAQSMGKKNGGENAQDAYSYELIMNEQGSITLNGAPMGGNPAPAAIESSLDPVDGNDSATEKTPEALDHIKLP